MLSTRQPLAAHGTDMLPADGLLSRAQLVASLVLRPQVRGRTLLRAAFPCMPRRHRAESIRHLAALASVVHFSEPVTHIPSTGQTR